LKSTVSVHQYTPSISPGDGVSNSLFLIQRFLKGLGLNSDIYATWIDPALEDRVVDYSRYPDKGDLLLVHHAIAQPDEKWLTGLKDDKGIVYHNITPAHFFPQDSLYWEGSSQGREQLAKWPGLFRGGIAISPYNRQELDLLGYKNIHTIPLVVDLDNMGGVIPDPEIARRYEDSFNFIHVGRIVENKCQHDLVHALADLKETDVRLFLIGGVGSAAYHGYILELIERYGLEDRVIMPGKVSDEQLWGYYQAAGAFICLSEHEGFCIPLIEAGMAGLPVVAYDSTNIRHTVGDAGVLLPFKNSRDVANVMCRLINRPHWRRTLVKSARENIKRFSANVLIRRLAKFLGSMGVGVTAPETDNALLCGDNTPGPRRLSIDIQGPFDSSYSLAMVNRYLASALAGKGYEISLFSTEGDGDYTADRAFLDRHPDIKAMVRTESYSKPSDVLIRNLYPPRVSRMNGLFNVLGPYGWEESGFPGAWVARFNRNLDLVATMSESVTKLMLDNGIRVPLATVGIGADHILDIDEVPLGIDLPEGYTLLHISSCFPRKGADLLLKAFEQTFGPSFKAVLVIKTFPNPHNTLRDQLVDRGWDPVSSLVFQRPGAAGHKLVLIEDDLAPGQIKALYRACDLLVAPGRGEGFGLPMAEAMALGVPVLTTALGGQADFCTPDTAWLIDGHFERAQTHMELDDSVWVEPDFDDLVAKMRMIPKLPKADIQAKTTAARSKILAHHTWDGAVSRLIKACDRVKALEALGEEPRIGWVTTWNCACGIASYSQMLTRAFSEKITILTNYVDDSRPEKDSGHVIRCWETGGKDSLAHLFDVITGQGLTRVVIQFNFSFFDLKALGRLIVALEERGIRTFLFFHSTADVKPPNEPKTISLILKELRRCCRLFVHSVHDLNRFKKWGLVENVALFPHGVDVKPPRADSNEDRADDGPLIAGFGFLLPHKGIFELIKAFRILRDSRPGARLMLLTALYPGGLSDHENQRCKKLIENMPFSKDITLVTDYLGESDIHHRLSKADIIVYPYRNTQESSSAAVRAGLAAMVPVAVSPLDIFEDVADVVHVLPGFSPEQIVQGIKAVLDDHEGKAKISERQTKWLNTHDWHVIGRRLYNILSAFGPVRPPGP